MKGTTIWSAVSLVMVLSLVLAACAPKAPAEVAPKEVVAEKEVVTEKEAASKQVVPKPTEEEPKYGGRITTIMSTDVRGFDQAYLTTDWTAQSLNYERLTVGDRTKGPAGSNETPFMASAWAPQGFMRETGAVAESWEIPDNQTIIYRIRKGIRFHNKPPVNGRELDANDVAFSIKYMYLNPKVPITYNVNMAPGAKGILSVTATDKWTVVVKVAGLAHQFFPMMSGMGMHMVPHEVIEQYGSLKDWRNALGTGPFILTDYIPNSLLSFVKNPNYWMKDELGPGKGNQLPYVDGVSLIVIADKSTMMSALRTGKVDHLSERLGLRWEDLQSLLKTNPKLLYKGMFPAPPELSISSISADPRAAPLKNQRVRWALSMAIDRGAMIRDYYQGQAMMRAAMFPPATPYFPSSRFYSTDDEMVEILKTVHGMKPEAAQMVKKIFEYHPEEAKRILAEEGYPNGFKTTVLLTSTNVDELSVIAGYWKRNLNIDLELDVRESRVVTTVSQAHTYPAMYRGTDLSLTTGAERWNMYGPSDPNGPRYMMNFTEINDPKINAAISAYDAVFGDYDARGKIMKETEPYILWLNWDIRLPIPFQYTMWHPWLKNYYGETAIGFKSFYNWVAWAWLDQDLKAKTLGKK